LLGVIPGFNREVRKWMGLTSLAQGAVANTLGWSEVAMHFRLTSASADFESGKPIKNDQITSSFRCF